MSNAPSDHSILPGFLLPHRSISLSRRWFLVFPILSLSVAFWVGSLLFHHATCLSAFEPSLQAIHQPMVTVEPEFLMAYPLSLRGDILFSRASVRCRLQN